jgi:hypothetical protein
MIRRALELGLALDAASVCCTQALQRGRLCGLLHMRRLSRAAMCNIWLRRHSKVRLKANSGDFAMQHACQPTVHSNGTPLKIHMPVACVRARPSH